MYIFKTAHLFPKGTVKINRAVPLPGSTYVHDTFIDCGTLRYQTGPSLIL